MSWYLPVSACMNQISASGYARETPLKLSVLLPGCQWFCAAHWHIPIPVTIRSEVSFQSAKVEVNTRDLDIVSKVRGWLMPIEIWFVRKFNTQGVNNTQTQRVHKAVLTKQRSEALKPMILPQASKIKLNKNPLATFFLADAMKWHTSVDLLAHAWVPNLNIGSFFSSTCFLH